VFLAQDAHSALAALDAANAARTDADWVESFRNANSWDARFAAGPLA
jgi:hypothetical protein